MKVNIENLNKKKPNNFDLLDQMGCYEIAHIVAREEISYEEENYIITTAEDLEHFIIIGEEENFYIFDASRDLSDILKNDFDIFEIKEINFVEEFNLSLRIRE